MTAAHNSEAIWSREMIDSPGTQKTRQQPSELQGEPKGVLFCFIDQTVKLQFSAQEGDYNTYPQQRLFSPAP